MLSSLLIAHAAVGLLVIACGRRLHRRALALAALPPAATALWLLTRLPGVIDGRPVVERTSWIPQLGIELDLRLDGFAALMALLVSGIGVAVIAYADGYLRPFRTGDARLVGLLVLFAGSMLGIAVADNVIVLFACWELTTITSYLLIGNDHTKARARAAARHALLITGTGGLALLGGLVLLAERAGTYRLSELLADPPAPGAAVSVALVAVLVGAATKSAIYPFHSWLPGAMVAPTPVSAYLHSATMVKAGIVLVARFGPAFATYTPWRPIVLIAGLVTFVAAGLRALRQFDLKLLLAHSTVSTLGLLFVLFGLGTTAATLAGCALLVAHALYKATLFMVIGMVDHGTGTRDLRLVGRLGATHPAWRTAEVVAVVAALSMAGVGAVFGFVAKELALEAVLHGGPGASLVTIVVVVLGAALGAAAAIRVVWGLLSEPFEERPGAGPAVLPADTHPPAAAFLAPAAALTALTLGLGIAPGAADGLLDAARAALWPSAGAMDPVHLALWHGLTTALALSLVAVALGAAAFAGRRPLERVLAVGARLPNGDAAYLAVLRWLNVLADRVTAVVQSGSLPLYAAVILTTAAVVPTVALLRGGTPFERPAWVDLPVHVPLAALLLAAALAAALVRRRFAAALFLGVAGYAMAGIFMAQGAPDLALTQVVFETLSTVLFMLVLRQLPDGFQHRSPRPIQAARLVVAAAVGAMVFTFMLATSSVGHDGTLGDELIARSLPDGYGRNVVNVILVDFRAMDTLGEITVLAVAAIGAVALARASRRAPRPPAPAGASAHPDRLLVADLPVRLSFHALLIGSVFALFAGHNQPGGGFVGGLLAGAAIALRFVGGGIDEVRRITRFKPWTVLGSGVAVAAGTALFPLLLGRPLLTSLERTIPLGMLGTAKPSTTLPFDLGVYLVVVGLVLMVFEAFGDERTAVLGDERTAVHREVTP